MLAKEALKRSLIFYLSLKGPGSKQHRIKCLERKLKNRLVEWTLSTKACMVWASVQWGFIGCSSPSHSAALLSFWYIEAVYVVRILVQLLLCLIRSYCALY